MNFSCSNCDSVWIFWWNKNFKKLSNWKTVY